jgi:hypothetical protein
MSVIWVLNNGNYEVSSLNHFKCIASVGVGFTISGSPPPDYLSASYIQTINIDCNGYTMIPIGTSVLPFTGSYNAQNYEIQNWQNDQSSLSDYQAIFGYVNNSLSIIKNIYITGLIKVKGNASCGILCGYGINCKINNINMNLSINSSLIGGYGYLGSIIGYFSSGTTGIIEKIRIGGYLTITNAFRYCGGVCGEISGSGIIRDIILSTVGDIISEENVLGGILGVVASTITVGGLINEMQGNINGFTNVGGIIGSGGNIYSTINRMKGNISGTICIGGIVGKCSGSIEDNINIMEGNIIYTTITNTGGILGYTITANQSIKRNICAIKGNTPAGICKTYSATPSLANNIFSNRFGMTIDSIVTTTTTTNNGTYVTLDSYPTTELTTSGSIKYWNLTSFIPIWIYTYTDVFNESQTITSDSISTVNWILNNGSYEVSSLNHLRCIALLGVGFIINGSPPSNYLSASYLQTTNIDCTENIMIPIGTSVLPFTGSYNAQNYEIQNWQNNQSSTSDNQGIFGYVNNSLSIIINIYITGLTKVKGANNCGILCGNCIAKVNNINMNLSLNSIINGVQYIGGLIGLIGNISSTIEKIRIKGYLTVIGSSSSVTGVIGGVGTASTNIRDIILSTIGNITGGTDTIAGIIGYCPSTTASLYGLINEMQGNITSSTTFVGGIIGNTNSGIYSCINKMKGNLTGASFVGGIVGKSTNLIEDCINVMEGNITGTTVTNCGGIGYTSMVNPSIKRNIIAIKGNIPSTICNTISSTTNVLNNYFNNRFGMTVNNTVLITSSLTNGTYVTLDYYPNDLPTTGYNKNWDSGKKIPYWIYTYINIFGITQTINALMTNNTDITINWVLTNGNYEVSSINHLRCIASMEFFINTTGNPPSNYLSASYIQTTNIDCNGYVMSPIGTNISPFTGSYNGQNYEIQNWQNDQSSTSGYQSIFGYVSGTPSILTNISVTGLVKVSGNDSCSILCAEIYNNGKISNINLDLAVNSVLNGNQYCGSILGVSRGCIMEKIRVKGYLTMTYIGQWNGGIVGYMSDTCYFRDIILSTIGNMNNTNNFLGGIIGYVDTTLATIGGLINEMQGNINGSTNVGGIIGTSKSSIYSCINRMKGNIIGQSSIGGIVGKCTGSIEDNINIMEGNIVWTIITNTGGILGYTNTANQSIKRNVVAMKGNTPSGICNTYGATTTNIINNVFSNRFSMTISSVVTTTSTINNGTYITLNSYPTTELTTSGYIKYWDSSKNIPYFSYTYLDIFGFSQTISSYNLSYYGAHLDMVTQNNQGLSNTIIGDVVLNSINSTEKINFGCGKNTNPKLTLLYNNIGINTTSPIYSLDINTTDAIKISSGLTSDRPLISTTGMIRYNTDLSKYECYSNNNWCVMVISNSNNGISINNNNLISNTLDITDTVNISSNLYINSRVGICLTNPMYSLDVSGITNVNNNINILSNLGIGNTNNLYKLDVSGNVFIAPLIAEGNLYIQNGLVGIGTTNPLCVLDLKGSMNISSNLFVTEKISSSNSDYNVSIMDASVNNYNLSLYDVGLTSIITNTVGTPLENESIYLNGNYFYFNGITALQYNWQTNNAFTVESWIYLKSYGSFDGNINIPRFVGIADPTSGNNGWSFGNTSNGRLCLYYYNGSLTYVLGTTILALNTWYHIAFTMNSNVITFYINGIIEINATFVGTLYPLTYYLMIGRYNSCSPNLYFRNLHINKTCLYFANFTPQNFISSTTDINTLLLIKTTPNYNVNINGSLNATSINNLQSYNIEDFEYPPSTLTGLTTTLNDGQYITSCSSKYLNSSTYDSYKVFNKNYGSDFWSSLVNTYSTTTGITTNTASTTNIDGSSIYYGEWLQIQLPTPITLTKYKLYNRTSYGIQFPVTFKLFGSINGINWITLDQQDNISLMANYQDQGSFVERGSGYNTFYTKTVNSSYNYYRLGINKVLPISNGVVSIGELVLYGKPSTTTALLNSSILTTIYTNDLNVGIGTTNPQGKLHIYNPNSTENTLILTNGGSYNEFNKSQIRFGYNGGTDYSHFIGTRHNTLAQGNCIDFYCNNGTSNLTNSINVGTTLVMTLEGTGNVGLGITNPGAQLDLSTDTARKGVSSAWVISSDKRIKDNITIADYNLCYNTLSNLDLKYFEWTNDIEEYSSVFDKHKLGWIADEVELYLPKAVTIENERYGLSNFKSLNTDQIYASMYGTVKKLIKDIEKLKEENKNIDFLIQKII